LVGDPANVLWQTDLVIALRSLALAGDEARPRLVRALEIARTLRDQGRLGGEEPKARKLLSRGRLPKMLSTVTRAFDTFSMMATSSMNALSPYQKNHE
jgi:hypothetical protein